MESGLQFDFSYAPGTSWQQMMIFEMAGELWSEYLTDNMTVNIHVEMTTALPGRVIGGALPGIIPDVSYADFRDAYQNDLTSSADIAALDGLPLTYQSGQESFAARVDLGAESFVHQGNNLDLTSANAKALGLLNPHSTELDGYIMINDLSNSAASWSYGTSSTWISSDDQLDLFSVAVHEVGHILGFISGVDKSKGLFFKDQNELQNYFGKGSKKLTKYLDTTVDRANPLDLFRYSSESRAIDAQGNTIDLSFGSDAYFASDGHTREWNFSRGKNKHLGGDGYQASHWQVEDFELKVQGIMDPVLKTGSSRQISNRDLASVDLLGYDLSTSAIHLSERAEATSILNVAAVNRSFQLLDDLQSQAIENLTQERPHWTELNDLDNWMAQRSWNANDIVQNFTREVQQMIQDSEVYEGRRGKSSSRVYSQEGVWQAAYFNEFSWQEFYVEAITPNNFSGTLESVQENQGEISTTSVADIDLEDNSPEDSLMVSNVTMDLFSLAETQEDTSATTTSTELETELVKQENSNHLSIYNYSNSNYLNKIFEKYGYLHD